MVVYMDEVFVLVMTGPYLVPTCMKGIMNTTLSFKSLGITNMMARSK